jgi:trans-aconitate methyltransferase
MTGSNARSDYWENVYATKGEKDVSWFQQRADVSIEIIDALWGPKPASFIDIGGGASRLADALIQRSGFRVTVLDLSKSALESARNRIGPAADNITWIVADITQWKPTEVYDVWHDRAALHFLTDENDRARYVEALRSALQPGGIAIIGTFAPDGPEKCSGLPVMRHDAASLGAMLGEEFELIDSRPHMHQTPWGSVQSFQFSSVRRLI